MTFLEKIQTKSHAEKMRLIWIVVGLTTLVLISLWILTSKISRNSPKDVSLFKTISRGFKDVSKQYKNN